MPDASLKIESLWICPPLGFARFGQLDEPMVNFHWASNDYEARGTAETVILPTTTFQVDSDGNISAFMPEEICFREGEKWRPVCPFFEVHCRLSDGSEGPLTKNKLNRCGFELADLQWRIHAANRKAFHYTLAEGDHVDAIVEIPGDHHESVPLHGHSPNGAKNPLVLKQPVSFGSVQVIRPGEDWPEVRLRITPPKGRIYAPTNTADRDLTALVPPNQSTESFLEKICTILNPASPWAEWKPQNDDYRTNPAGLYAQERNGTSLGFFDDSNDGLITVSLIGMGAADGRQMAHARFSCCPPDFQPDRRPFRSIADGLTDLIHREDVSHPSYVEGAQWPETELEIADFMQRVRETMEASNLDHQNLRSQLGNANIDKDDPQYPFEPAAPRPGHPLPLTELGRMNHARFLAYEVFKANLAQRPGLFDQWIRNPAAEPIVYNKQMPALMRGSDSYPMTISQRQYNLLRSWLDRISNEGGPDGKARTE